MACYIVKMQKYINRRLTISVTDMKLRIRHNRFGNSRKNRSSLFSREEEFNGSIFGLVTALLRVHPKRGAVVYRAP